MSQDENGYIILTIRVHREDGLYVARCEELGVSSFGKTFEEADARILEAVTLYLDELEVAGVRARVFAEAGIHVRYGETDREQVRVAAVPDEDIVSVRRVALPDVALASREPRCRDPRALFQ